MAARQPRSNASSLLRWWKPIALAVVVVALFILALTLDLGEKLEQLRGWIDGLGIWGPVAFIAIYIVATVAMVPGTAMTTVAGGVFGALWGSVYVSIGATAGAAASFLIARYFARNTVADWLKDKEQFQRLDRVTETHGAWIVAGTRLAPIIPFNLLNYAFGLTRVGFWTYLFWSWLCMIPGSVVYVVGVDALATGLREGRVPWGLIAVAAVGLLVVLVLAWYARRKLLSGVSSMESERK